jgi:hypothetical protein
VSRLAGIPEELAALLRSIATDFPVILEGNLVGVCLWGSLSYDAFDEPCSDVDAVVVTRWGVSGNEFAALEKWFGASTEHNPWTGRLDIRFVIDGEFLDKRSRCCGFHSGKLVRPGSDGKPIIWLNIGESSVTLWGREAKLIAPAIPDSCLHDALLLELDYLREGLAKKAGDRSQQVARYNACSVLTACRILYTADHRRIVSKERACRWVLVTFPPQWQPVVEAAWRSRRSCHGSATPRPEHDTAGFVRFAGEETRRTLSLLPPVH